MPGAPPPCSTHMRAALYPIQQFPNDAHHTIRSPHPNRHGNSQVCLQALDCLLALIPQLRLYELTPHAKGLCLTLGEALGDSRYVYLFMFGVPPITSAFPPMFNNPQHPPRKTPTPKNSPSVRERTQEALGLVAAKVGGGPAAVLEGLGPALQNARNPRMRQEAARCLGRLASGALVPGAFLGVKLWCGMLNVECKWSDRTYTHAHAPTTYTQPTELDPEERRLLLEALAALARDDPHPDVQAAAQTGLTRLLTQDSNSTVIDELEALGLPRSLLQQLAAGAAPSAAAEMPPPEPAVAPAPAPPVPAPAPARRAAAGGAPPPPPGRSNEKEGA